MHINKVALTCHGEWCADIRKYYTPGTLIFFEGHIVHRGRAHEVQNIAWHLYLDVPEVMRERDLSAKGSFHYREGPSSSIRCYRCMNGLGHF